MALLPAEVRLRVNPIAGALEASTAAHTITIQPGQVITVADLMARLEFDPVRARPAGEEEQERIGRRAILIREELDRFALDLVGRPKDRDESDKRQAALAVVARGISERIEGAGR